MENEGISSQSTGTLILLLFLMFRRKYFIVVLHNYMLKGKAKAKERSRKEKKIQQTPIHCD